MYLATGEPWRQYFAPSLGGAVNVQECHQDVVVQPHFAWHAHLLQRPVILDVLVVSPGEERFSSSPPLLAALRKSQAGLPGLECGNQHSCLSNLWPTVPVGLVVRACRSKCSSKL
eukprot:1368170-Amphidinium_carterae.1